MGRRVVLFLAAACLSCGDGSSSGAYLTTLESGATWVHSTPPGSWSSDEAWIASEVLRLGTVEGLAAEQFGTVGAFTFVGDSVAVLDRSAQVVRLFDPDGSHLRTFGARGDGPGEFAFADGLAPGTNGSLFVVDARRPAILEFSSGGELLRSLHHQFGSAGGVTGLIRVGEQTYDWIVDFPGPRRADAVGAPRVRYRPTRFNPGPASTDTFPGIVLDTDLIGGPTNPLDGEIRIAPTADPERFWFNASADYRVTLRNLEGDTLRVVSLEGAVPAPVPSSMRDSIRSVDAELAAALPATFPAVDFIATDGRGHLLVFPHLDGARRGSLVDVFRESSGEYLGRVTLPSSVGRYPTPVAHGRRIMASSKGPFGINQVVVFSIGPPE